MCGAGAAVGGAVPRPGSTVRHGNQLHGQRAERNFGEIFGKRIRGPGHRRALRVHAGLPGAPEAHGWKLREGSVLLPPREQAQGCHRAVVLLVLRLRKRPRRHRRGLHGHALLPHGHDKTPAVRHGAKRQGQRDVRHDPR